MILHWRREHDYFLAQDFLKDLVDGPCGKSKTRFGEIDFYLLETEAQFDALMEFRLKLKNILGPINRPDV